MTARLALLLALLIAFVGVAPARAEGIAVNRFTMTSSWPSGARVDFSASSDSEIISVTASVTSGRGSASVLRRPTFTPGRQVSGSFNASPGNVSPFGIIRVTLTFEDAAGNRVRTDQQAIQYVDSRFQWQQETEGLVTAYWHAPADGRAILRAAVDTVDRVGRFGGVRLDRPVTMVVYNSKEEMDSVVSYGSATSRAQLVIQGQARSNDDLVLVMSGPGGEVTAAHELAHLITAEAAGDSLRTIPFWLNEGLSVYFQGDDGPEYRRRFEDAKRSGQLLSLRAMTTPPGKPDELLLMYGQGYQLAKYLVETYGAEKMARFLAAHKTTADDDATLRQVYGFDRDGFEREWRAAIGADAEPPAVPGVPSASRRAELQWMIPVLAGATIVFVLGISVLLGMLILLRRSGD